MKIRCEDVETILGGLPTGNFVAFPENGITPLGKEALQLFTDRYEAFEYCFENSTDRDVYNFLSTERVTAALKAWQKNKTLAITKEGIVDVSLLVVLYETGLSNNIKQWNMNQKNYDYLADQIKFTGFGEELKEALKEKMSEGNADFKLKHQTSFGKDEVLATLSFSQSKQSDMYFFNSYRLSLQKPDQAQDMEQTFYINKGNNITLKEAYNLMEGRAVNKDLTNKEGEVYNAWIQMDFKQSDNSGNFKMKHYHQNYGFDLESVLSKHPIRELANANFKKDLMDSLKKGNLQSATFKIDGVEQKQYIEANPQFKTVNIYDSNLQRIDNRLSKKEQQSEGESKTVKQDGKKETNSAADEEGETPKATKQKRKSRQIS